MIRSLALGDGCLVVVRQHNELQAWLLAEAAEGSGVAECCKHDCLRISDGGEPNLAGLSEWEDGSVLLYMELAEQLVYVELTRDEDGRFRFSELTCTSMGPVDANGMEVAPKNGLCYFIRPALNLGCGRLNRESNSCDYTDIDAAEARRNLRLPTQSACDSCSTILFAFLHPKHSHNVMAAIVLDKYCAYRELAVGEIMGGDKPKLNLKFTMNLSSKAPVALCWVLEQNLAVAHSGCVQLVSPDGTLLRSFNSGGLSDVVALFPGRTSRATHSLVAVRRAGDACELDITTEGISPLQLQPVGQEVVVHVDEIGDSDCADVSEHLPTPGVTRVYPLRFRSAELWALLADGGLVIMERASRQRGCRTSICPLHVAPQMRSAEPPQHKRSPEPFARRVSITDRGIGVLYEGLTCEEHAYEELNLLAVGNDLLVAHDAGRQCDWLLISNRPSNSSLVLSGVRGEFQPADVPGLCFNQPTLLWTCVDSANLLVQVTPTHVRALELRTLAVAATFDLVDRGRDSSSADAGETILHATTAGEIVLVVTQHRELALEAKHGSLRLAWQRRVQPDTHIHRAAYHGDCVWRYYVSFSDRCRQVQLARENAATGEVQDRACFTLSEAGDDEATEAVVGMEVVSVEGGAAQLVFVVSSRDKLSVWRCSNEQPVMVGCHVVPRGACKLLVIRTPSTPQGDQRSVVQRAAVLVYGGREAAVVTATQSDAGSGVKWATDVHAFVGCRPHVSAAVVMRFNDLEGFTDTHRFRSLCPWNDALDAPVSLAMLNDTSYLCLARVLPWTQRSAASVRCSVWGRAASVAVLPGSTADDDLIVSMTCSTMNVTRRTLQACTLDLKEIVFRLDDRPFWGFAVLGNCLGVLVWIKEEQCARVLQLAFEVTPSPEGKVIVNPDVVGGCRVWEEMDSWEGAAIAAAPDGGRGWYALAGKAQCKVVAWVEDEPHDWRLRVVATFTFEEASKSSTAWSQTPLLAACGRLIAHQANWSGRISILYWNIEQHSLQEILVLHSNTQSGWQLALTLQHVETTKDGILHVYKLHSDAGHHSSDSWEITANIVTNGECQITAVPCPRSSVCL